MINILLRKFNTSSKKKEMKMIKAIFLMKNNKKVPGTYICQYKEVFFTVNSPTDPWCNMLENLEIRKFSKAHYLKVMKNALCFNLNALFVFKKFKFLARLFCNVRKWLDKKAKVYDVRSWETNNYNKSCPISQEAKITRQGNLVS